MLTVVYKGTNVLQSSQKLLCYGLGKSKVLLSKFFLRKQSERPKKNLSALPFCFGVISQFVDTYFISEETRKLQFLAIIGAF